MKSFRPKPKRSMIFPPKKAVFASLELIPIIHAQLIYINCFVVFLYIGVSKPPKKHLTTVQNQND